MVLRTDPLTPPWGAAIEIGLYSIDPDILNREENYKEYQIGRENIRRNIELRPFCESNFRLCQRLGDDETLCYWLGRLQSIDGETE